MNEFQLTNGHVALLMLIALWDLAWKGVAMWKAGRNNDKLWFVLLLIFNTAGILPLVYIFILSKNNNKEKN